MGGQGRGKGHSLGGIRRLGIGSHQDIIVEWLWRVGKSAVTSYSINHGLHTKGSGHDLLLVDPMHIADVNHGISHNRYASARRQP